MKNYYADNPFFRISDDTADFFGPNLTQYFPQQEGPEEQERARREKERKDIRERLSRRLINRVWQNPKPEDVKAITTPIYELWDNGIPKDSSNPNDRWPASGPPWLFPSVRLAMRVDLFRSKDLDVFINRAKLEQLRLVERLAKEAASESIIRKNAQEISREEQIDFASLSGSMITEWEDQLSYLGAAVEMARAFVVSMNAVREVVSSQSEAVTRPPNAEIKLKTLVLWWKQRDHQFSGSANGTFDGLYNWVQSMNGRVLNSNGRPILQESLRTKFNGRAKDEVEDCTDHDYQLLDTLWRELET